MSSFTHSTASGGVDISSLTSGEQFLLGAVASQAGFGGAPLANSSSSYIQRMTAFNLPTFGDKVSLLNFTSVRSVTCAVHIYSYGNSTQASYIQWYMWDYTNNSSTTIINSNQTLAKAESGTWVSTSYTISLSGKTKSAVVGLTATYYQNSLNGSSPQCVLLISSYTTTDGKTHTSSNLNY